MLSAIEVPRCLVSRLTPHLVNPSTLPCIKIARSVLERDTCCREVVGAATRVPDFRSDCVGSNIIAAYTHIVLLSNKNNLTQITQY